jgi:hypothetical protein
MGTISECLFHILNLLPKGVQTIFKTFLVEDVFHLPPVSMTPAVNIYAKFQKNLKCPFLDTQGLAWGKLIHEKNLKS